MQPFLKINKRMKQTIYLGTKVIKIYYHVASDSILFTLNCDLLTSDST